MGRFNFLDFFTNGHKKHSACRLSSPKPLELHHFILSFSSPSEINTNWPVLWEKNLCPSLQVFCCTEEDKVHSCGLSSTESKKAAHSAVWVIPLALISLSLALLSNILQAVSHLLLCSFLGEESALPLLVTSDSKAAVPGHCWCYIQLHEKSWGYLFWLKRWVRQKRNLIVPNWLFSKQANKYTLVKTELKIYLGYIFWEESGPEGLYLERYHLIKPRSRG